MKITDLTADYLGTYCNCLEDWNDEIKEGREQKARWYDSMKEKGLGVKLAVTEDGTAVGMIQYLPVELSYAEGKELYFIQCIWVHGHKQGQGNHQKRGIGKALLSAAEEDAKDSGAAGMVAWGLSIPVWMKASWFMKQGYSRVDRLGFLGPALVWKPFREDAVPPRWIRKVKHPEKLPGKVTVTCFTNGWCTAQNMVHDRAKRASEEFEGKVVFQAIHTGTRESLREWGMGDALFINGREVRTGPPPSYEKLRKKIARQVKLLN